MKRLPTNYIIEETQNNWTWELWKPFLYPMLYGLLVRLVKATNPNGVSVMQRVIQEYVYQGNVVRTAEILNRRGFRIEDCTIEPQDITQAITSRPDRADTLHKEIRRLYLKKTKNSRKSKAYSYR